MKLRTISQGSVLAVAVMTLAACSGGGRDLSQLPSAASSSTAGQSAHRESRQLRAFAASCSATAAAVETGNCTNIEVAGPVLGPTTAAASVPGFHPADLQSAYALPSATGGKGQTIGIVVIGVDANLESDLAVYRKTFGLPACTSASGCLRIFSSQPAKAATLDWAHEVSIDVDMASAVCPNCKLIVEQVGTNAAATLISADTSAILEGATVVNNSFAIPESAAESNALWAHPGVPVVAAAGDDGYTTANWPAADSYVIAVGATTLTRAPSTARGWAETSWSGTNSACSAIAVKPAWQSDEGCGKRTVADVAAVGDPETPVAVYDTDLDTGWIGMGGTSVATPIIAGVYALAGNGAQLTGAQSLYTHAPSLFPVTSGMNGTCTAAYLCNGGTGYNGPGGLGSPNGVGAF
jgi:subtilase family serine protease